MRVDIWSDVRCPFCYIGKHKFEKALEQFKYKDNIEVIWHSFELDPNLKTEPNKDAAEHLGEIKGQTKEWGKQMHAHVSQIAKEAGLEFNLDNSVVANSFNAHRLIQLAKVRGLGNEMEEKLFKAYFTDGKNIDNSQALLELGIGIGLDKQEVAEVLNGDAYADAVHKDEAQAEIIGIRGVPFFIMNNQYSVSGAQSPETFLRTLEQAWSAYATMDIDSLNTIDEDSSCGIDGSC